MASSMVSRWPVLVTTTLRAGDRAADGQLTDAAVDRLFREGRAEYFDQCATIDGSAIAATITSIHQDGTAPEYASVEVVVGIVEIFAARLTMAARIRTASSDGLVTDATCDVAVDAVTAAMRDELIALAHSARHVF
jgi:hypothetical protein